MAGAGAGAGADAKKLATTFLVSGHIFIVPRDILTPMSAPANAAMDAEAEGIGSAPIHLPFMSALAFAQSMEFLKLLKAHLDATGGPWVSLPKVEQGIESESLDVILKDRPEILAFIKGVDYSSTLSLLAAGDYLNCQPLIEVAAAKIACKTYGKDGKNVSKMFALKPEEPGRKKKKKAVDEEEAEWLGPAAIVQSGLGEQPAPA